MNKLSKIFLIIIIILSVALGIMTYLYINARNMAKNNLNNVLDLAEETWKENVEKENNINTSNSKESSSTIVSLTDVISKEEIEKLKTKVEQDEADYGDKYQGFNNYPGVYKRKPDRIYFKSPDANGFYLYDNNDKDYEHLLKVTEDRMFYSTVEDYNLYCFTPDSIDTMMKSKDTYIIFDYDNGELSELDAEYQKNLIFRFPQATRLYRLATYLSYYKEIIPREKLGKDEFANNTKISGYKYIFSDGHSD